MSAPADFQDDSVSAAQLDQALGLAGARHAVVLDLGRLSLVDASGVHVIDNPSTHVRKVRRWFILVRGSSQVDRVLTLLAANQMLEIGDVDLPEPATGACAM